MTAPRPAIDWSQLWYPGRAQPFTADEMARAGADAPSPTLVVGVLLNAAVIGFVVLQLAPPERTAPLAAMLAMLAVMAVGLARWLWRRPWRRPLMQAQMLAVLAMVATTATMRWRVEDRAEHQAMALVLAVGTATLAAALWMLVVWRAAHIDARLREQAERERAVEMARRLAAAQIEPHFLFNTLAGVQHWVQTQDPRAAPLLESLTGYLRATLPMFSRPTHALADELEAVRRYLQVMQARFGSRLAWRIDVPEALHTLALPPGVLLTLVENAVEHGVEPQLRGGTVRLEGRVEGGHAIVDVRDDGPGPPRDMVDGVGLANVRERLALTRGPGASLALAPAADGGCIATLTLPWSPR